MVQVSARRQQGVEYSDCLREEAVVESVREVGGVTALQMRC